MKDVPFMKVTAFIGSARKKHTYNPSEQFLQKLQLLGDIEYEIVTLSDYNLGKGIYGGEDIIKCLILLAMDRASLLSRVVV